MILVLGAMLLYALLHTTLAGRGKTWFRQHFGERAYHGLYRVIYNGVAVMTLLPVIWLIVERPGPVVWGVPPRWELPFLMLQVVGLLGLSIALLQIDLLRFAGLTQLWAYLRRDPLPLPPEKLQTRGFYSLIRHPLYLFSLFAVWPVTTMTAAYLGFCVGVTMYFLIGAHYEEKRMLAAFGKSYAIYRARVPWILPILGRRGFPEDKT